MNRCRDNEFIYNSLELTCTCSYQWSKHADQLFTKDEDGNTVENWSIHVAKQKDQTTNAMWLTLIARNKAGENITQIDFDNVSKEKLEEFITDLLEIHDYNFGGVQ